MRIDAHQHFWIFDAVRDAWITDEMSVLKRNFLPTDLAPLLKASNVDAVIAVQADQSHQETQFLLDLAGMYAMVKAVIGWVDLQSPMVDEHLVLFQQYKIIKGFRHIVEAESDPEFLMRESVLNGLKNLADRSFTYDLLIKPIHYASTLSCVESNPNLQFVLDHMAKPGIKTREFDQWAEFINRLAAFPNVACKISGLANEADWHNWKVEDFQPYIQHVVQSFGKKRIMFGSDWPVCMLAADYEQAIHIVEQNLIDFTAEELSDFWGNNAKRIYNID